MTTELLAVGERRAAATTWIGGVVLALAAPTLMRLRPPRLQRTLLYLARPRAGEPTPVDLVLGRSERALGIAARLRPQTCLTRGVTRFVLLRRAGAPVDLVFGVGATEMAAHCWLELDGGPLLEARDPRGRFPEVFRVGTREHG